jgi:hypothetical protein
MIIRDGLSYLRYLDRIAREGDNKMKITKFTYMSALLLAMFFITAPSIEGQTKKKVTYYSIKTGTVMRARIDNNLSSKTSYVGQTFRNVIVDPIYSSGGVELIPSGSVITGNITAVRPAAKNGQPGSIDVSFTAITLPNNRRVAINGTLADVEGGKNNVDNEGTVSAKKTSKRNLKFIGGGAAGGAVIGGIAGGGTGALIGAGVGAVGGLIGKNVSKGKEAQVSAGTEFGVYLNRAISLPRYR